MILLNVDVGEVKQIISKIKEKNSMNRHANLDVFSAKFINSIKLEQIFDSGEEKGHGEMNRLIINQGTIASNKESNISYKDSCINMNKYKEELSKADEYYSKGNYEKAKNYYEKGLKLIEELKKILEGKEVEIIEQDLNYCEKRIKYCDGKLRQRRQSADQALRDAKTQRNLNSITENYNTKTSRPNSKNGQIALEKLKAKEIKFGQKKNNIITENNVINYNHPVIIQNNYVFKGEYKKSWTKEINTDNYSKRDNYIQKIFNRLPSCETKIKEKKMRRNEAKN